MSDDPTPTEKPAETKEARVILPKGTAITIGTLTLTLQMNAVVSGDRAQIVAAGLEPL